MDELEIMKNMQKANGANFDPFAAPEDEITQRKRRQLAEIKKIGIIALCCFAVIVTIFNILVNPLDRIKYKMSLFNNYIVTVSITGSDFWQTIAVDGNIIYTDDTYYETVDGQVYIYQKNTSGKWEKKKTSLTGTSNSTWLIALLEKENYTRNYLTGRMDYNRNFYVNGVKAKNFYAKVRFGNLRASGVVVREFDYGNYRLNISIGGFGLVWLTLPEV